MSAPDLFEPDEVDEWGRAKVLREALDPDDQSTLERARQAVAGCPERALTLS